MYRTTLVLLTALCAADTILAAEAWQSAPFAATPAQLLSAEVGGPVAEGTPVVVLTEAASYSLDANGKLKFALHRIYKVLTPAGVEGWDTTERRWEPWHENRPILKARVISAKGDVHDLDPATIAEVPVGESDGTYSDARVLKAPLPAVAAGCVVEEYIESAESAPVMGGQLLRRYFFGMGVPVGRTRLTVDVPQGTNLQYSARMLPAVDTQRKEADGRLQITWTQGYLAPREDQEDDLPCDADRAPNVVFSTGRSWAVIAETYNKLVEDQLQGADLARLLPKKVQKDISKLELANLALARVHDEIRYTGIEFAEASIVPRRPAELLKRAFGDCKDQAALLVAVLRAVGIPANVALLNSGYGTDIDPKYPGWGRFDHAIVYVPGAPALWADPTSRYSRFNELPLGDRNRWALIAKDGGELVRTPPAMSRENRETTTREFRLPEKGNASVIETTRATGSIELAYRASYSRGEEKERKKSLDHYAKEAFLSDKSVKYENSTPADLAKPFELRIEVSNATRGLSDGTEAVVAIPIGWIANRLPEALRQKPDDKHPARKNDFVLDEPYVAEWNYRIIPPPGFRATPLPDSGEVSLGATKLVKKFHTLPDGTVEAHIEFDTVKSVFSAAEFEATRKALDELAASPMTMVRFELTANALLKEGKTRAAVDEFSRLIELHPKESLHHLQLAQALLDGGVAEAARKEARAAIELEPNEASAHRGLGWILEHDLAGRRFQPGCDLPGAEREYRKAIELKSDDDESRASLAILLEFEPSGERYGAPDKLKEALRIYGELRDKLTGPLENNELFALERAGEFKQLRERAESKHNPTADLLYLTAVAAIDGADAAVREAKKRITDESARRTALSSAGQQLIVLRLYKAAAIIIAAAAEGTGDSESARTRSQVIAKAEPFEDALKRTKGPERALFRYLTTLYHNTADGSALRNCFSKSLADVTDAALTSEVRAATIVKNQSARQGITIDNVTDLVFAAATVKVDGDDSSAHRVRCDVLAPDGSHKITAFVVREDSDYYLLGVDNASTLGAVALRSLDSGDMAAARRILDWVREMDQLPGGEDPLAGTPFPRFWTRGSDPGARAVRFAAASLMARTNQHAKAIEILEPGLRNASSDDERIRFQLALHAAYMRAKRYDEAIGIARVLLDKFPDSDSAESMLFSGLVQSLKLDEAWQIAQKRVAMRPNERARLRAAAMLAMIRSDYAAVGEFEQRVVVQGEASSIDLNQLAWAELCSGHVTPKTIETAQDAVKMDKALNFGTLHTLASVYAEAGKTSEARQVILHAMDVAGIQKIDGNSWYVFGKIAEEYGRLDAALSAYGRVEKPETEIESGGSTWALAQQRLAALHADQH